MNDIDLHLVLAASLGTLCSRNAQLPKRRQFLRLNDSIDPLLQADLIDLFETAHHLIVRISIVPLFLHCDRWLEHELDGSGLGNGAAKLYQRAESRLRTFRQCLRRALWLPFLKLALAHASSLRLLAFPLLAVGARTSYDWT